MYEFKTTPISHQLEEFNTHWKDRARGLLWEMGTGKSKETIDQCALYEDGRDRRPYRRRPRRRSPQLDQRRDS
jgi:hypothetical protein